MMEKANTYAMDQLIGFNAKSVMAPREEGMLIPFTPTPRHVNFQHGFMMPNPPSILYSSPGR